MHGLEFSRLSDQQHEQIDRLLVLPLRRILRLPLSVHPLLILALFGLPSSSAIRHALVLKFDARASSLSPPHPTHDLHSLLSDRAQHAALFPGSTRFRSFASDVVIAKQYCDYSPTVLTSTRLFVVARIISLKILKQTANSSSPIKRFLDDNSSDSSPFSPLFPQER